MKKSFLNLDSMKKTAPKAAAAFGGLVVGRFVSGALDTIIETPAVSGFLEGIQMKQAAAKYVKPAIVTTIGLGVYAYGEKQKSDVLKYGAIGMAAYGASNLLSAATGKSYFSGFLGENLDGDDDFRIVDENGKEISGLNAPFLPALAPAHQEEYVEGTGDDAEIAFEGYDDYAEAETAFNGNIW